MKYSKFLNYTVCLNLNRPQPHEGRQLVGEVWMIWCECSINSANKGISLRVVVSVDGAVSSGVHVVDFTIVSLCCADNQQQQDGVVSLSSQAINVCIAKHCENYNTLNIGTSWISEHCESSNNVYWISSRVTVNCIFSCSIISN